VLLFVVIPDDVSEKRIWMPGETDDRAQSERVKEHQAKWDYIQGQLDKAQK